VQIGEGLGCLPVVIVAAWHPERVGRVILVGPTCAAPLRDGIEARALRECPPDWPALLRSVTCDVMEMPADVARDGGIDPALLERVEAFLVTPLP
jgi:hypothetical protein